MKKQRPVTGVYRKGDKKRPARRDSSSKELFDAVCANCGKDCQVPFRPSGDKPVLCRDCFKGQPSEDRPRRSFRQSSDSNSKIENQLRHIERKLDEILERL